MKKLIVILTVLACSLLLIPIAGASDTDVDLTVEVVGPTEFEESFGGSLVRNARDYICTIPEEAIELEITLGATDDLDLELYDESTFVIGWKGEIDSSGSTACSYEGDEFGYSGYDGGDEFITADGPLGQAYDLWVFAYRAGSYAVDVCYKIPGPPNPSPTIDIDVADVDLGEEATVVVVAVDPDGVKSVSFWSGLLM